MSDVLLQENVNGNLIRIDDDGGVITKFGNVQEGYQLAGEEAQDLVALLNKYDARTLLDDIPAPKLIDLSVGMTRGDIDFSEFLYIKKKFELEPKYMSEYRLMYEIGVKKTDWEIKEPHTDILTLQTEMNTIKDKMINMGMDKVPDAEQTIGDSIQPTEVQHIDFPKMR